MSRYRLLTTIFVEVKISTFSFTANFLTTSVQLTSQWRSRRKSPVSTAVRQRRLFFCFFFTLVIYAKVTTCENSQLHNFRHLQWFALENEYRKHELLLVSLVQLKKKRLKNTVEDVIFLTHLFHSKLSVLWQKSNMFYSSIHCLIKHENPCAEMTVHLQVMISLWTTI